MYQPSTSRRSSHMLAAAVTRRCSSLASTAATIHCIANPCPNHSTHCVLLHTCLPVQISSLRCTRGQMTRCSFLSR
jgi:hypothetical protein